MLDINQIRDILPHRYPILLVDRILEAADGHIVGLKNVTANEPFFQGHFPDYPVMPGVMIVEAMAQVGAVLLLRGVENRADKLVFFTGIEEAKFRKPVTPGDQLRIEMKVLRRRATVCKMKGTVTVDGKLVAEAILMCQLADRPAHPDSSAAASSSAPSGS